jgi:hypothetical protein
MKSNDKEGGSMREGTNKKTPSKEQKLKAWQYMKKHALPRMKDEGREKSSESKSGPGSSIRKEKE